MTDIPTISGERFYHNFRTKTVLNLINDKQGELHLSNYRLVFIPHEVKEKSTTMKQKMKDKLTIKIHLHSIYKIEKVGHASMSNGPSEYYIEITRRDFQRFRFGFYINNADRKAFFTGLNDMISKSATDVHAFRYQLRSSTSQTIVDPDYEEKNRGWFTKEDLLQEFVRLGADCSAINPELSNPLSSWRVSTVNTDFSLCPTYPPYLAVPKQVSDSQLQQVATFRTKHRIPILSYVHPNGAAVIRSSQPGSGIKKRNDTDEHLLRVLSRNVSFGHWVKAKPIQNEVLPLQRRLSDNMMNDSNADLLTKGFTEPDGTIRYGNPSEPNDSVLSVTVNEWSTNHGVMANLLTLVKEVRWKKQLRKEAMQRKALEKEQKYLTAEANRLILNKERRKEGINQLWHKASDEKHELIAKREEMELQRLEQALAGKKREEKQKIQETDRIKKDELTMIVKKLTTRGLNQIQQPKQKTNTEITKAILENDKKRAKIEEASTFAKQTINEKKKPKRTGDLKDESESDDPEQDNEQIDLEMKLENLQKGDEIDSFDDAEYEDIDGRKETFDDWATQSGDHEESVKSKLELMKERKNRMQQRAQTKADDHTDVQPGVEQNKLKQQAFVKRGPKPDNSEERKRKIRASESWSMEFTQQTEQQKLTSLIKRSIKERKQISQLSNKKESKNSLASSSSSHNLSNTTVSQTALEELQNTMESRREHRRNQRKNQKKWTFEEGRMEQASDDHFLPSDLTERYSQLAQEKVTAQREAPTEQKDVKEEDSPQSVEIGPETPPMPTNVRSGVKLSGAGFSFGDVMRKMIEMSNQDPSLRTAMRDSIRLKTAPVPPPSVSDPNQDETLSMNRSVASLCSTEMNSPLVSVGPDETAEPPEPSLEEASISASPPAQPHIPQDPPEDDEGDDEEATHSDSQVQMADVLGDRQNNPHEQDQISQQLLDSLIPSLAQILMQNQRNHTSPKGGDRVSISLKSSHHFTTEEYARTVLSSLSSQGNQAALTVVPNIIRTQLKGQSPYLVQKVMSAITALSLTPSTRTVKQATSSHRYTRLQSTNSLHTHHSVNMLATLSRPLPLPPDPFLFNIYSSLLAYCVFTSIDITENWKQMIQTEYNELLLQIKKLMAGSGSMARQIGDSSRQSDHTAEQTLANKAQAVTTMMNESKQSYINFFDSCHTQVSSLMLATRREKGVVYAGLVREIHLERFQIHFHLQRREKTEPVEQKPVVQHKNVGWLNRVTLKKPETKEIDLVQSSTLKIKVNGISLVSIALVDTEDNETEIHREIKEREDLNQKEEVEVFGDALKRQKATMEATEEACEETFDFPDDIDSVYYPSSSTTDSSLLSMLQQQEILEAVLWHPTWIRNGDIRSVSNAVPLLAFSHPGEKSETHNNVLSTYLPLRPIGSSLAQSRFDIPSLYDLELKFEVDRLCYSHSPTTHILSPHIVGITRAFEVESLVMGTDYIKTLANPQSLLSRDADGLGTSTAGTLPTMASVQGALSRSTSRTMSFVADSSIGLQPVPPSTFSAFKQKKEAEQKQKLRLFSLANELDPGLTQSALHLSLQPTSIAPSLRKTPFNPIGHGSTLHVGTTKTQTIQKRDAAALSTQNMSRQQEAFYNNLVEWLLFYLPFPPSLFLPPKRLCVVDCRPGLNAYTNAFLNGGYEKSSNYPFSTLTFMQIGNIHKMRAALREVQDAAFKLEQRLITPQDFLGTVAPMLQTHFHQEPADSLSLVAHTPTVNLQTVLSSQVSHLGSTSGWMIHIHRTLRASIIAANRVHRWGPQALSFPTTEIEYGDGQKCLLLSPGEKCFTSDKKGGGNVLVHCTDGWDRTPTVTCLAMILLDPYYRTLAGFETLIEKEWVWTGHQFARRKGCFEVQSAPLPNDTLKSQKAKQIHAQVIPTRVATSQPTATVPAKQKKQNIESVMKESGPIFLQFLDCVYQLCVQNVTEFQFNAELLLFLYKHLYSGKFGNFLCNGPSEMEQKNIRKGTYSVWAQVKRKWARFDNPQYKHRAKPLGQNQSHTPLAVRLKDKSGQKGAGVDCTKTIVLPLLPNPPPIQVNLRKLVFWSEVFFPNGLPPGLPPSNPHASPPVPPRPPPTAPQPLSSKDFP
ncbi:putative Phosphatidylinositol-3-phosphatase myotubularin-1 [Blattamonas nauphoetae]|uniref:Phosphatidylinositol-3-phosphatase myotubularin-1 n=1 Tax=Blattamonas nauphoetae TaxID=2049346 RepID=A0ABQ9XGX3_9EUKA|nr:putative Phosphatidylinositol-3-phosphatase myotubularin-1 [Blattamonas nauphoetae]